MDHTFGAELARALGVKVIIPACGDITLMEKGIEVLPHYRNSGSDTESETEDLYLPGANPFVGMVYRPLKAEEFRLLVLNPGFSDEPIECFLEHYPVNGSKPFKALSYVWGTAMHNEPIRVDGFEFSVTENLYAFLKEFRKEYDAEILWIDAICIDQQNIPERNAQIRQMKRVYEGADSVVIWLGNEVSTTKEAFEHLSHIYDSFWLQTVVKHNRPGAQLSAITSEQVSLLFAGPSGSARAWDGIEDIFKRPWWSRIWVYQEATAPAKNGSVVICGRHTIEFTKILTVNKIVRNMISRFEGLDRLEQCNSLNAVYMHIYSELRRAYHETGTTLYLRLEDLISVLRGFDATNPRDKLYALIPTSVDGDELIDVNYELPVDEVYTNAALSIIQKHHSLDILGHCTMSETGSLENLPSWVPNWTSKSGPIPFFKRSLVSQKTSEEAASGRDVIGKLFNASGDTRAQTSIDRYSNILSVEGFIFDKVELVSPSTGNSHDSSAIAVDWIEWLDTLSCTPDAHQALRKALPRVLVADTYRFSVDVGMRGCIQPSLAGKVGNESLLKINAIEPDDIHESVTGPHPASFRRKLIVTEQGYLGLTAEQVEKNDVVAICCGGQLPLVLRATSNHYTLIGEAYIHGIMDGEAMTRYKMNGNASFQIIKIR
ncbi:uncharacterized protein PV09_07978 [Verruconis gallopava]|uniref:Heterokaryon incompatibility domain-containing protein n=1 Tax=Verruconis gallopava TaxID=253628 RepID=A0A0D2A1B8_9PEZI|nr:uncharacterized protein PV09_07978 [Verruconis gallopava]KIW00453.1 hypothetical protein PV09_07978 [Verruconis gallopava]